MLRRGIRLALRAGSAGVGAAGARSADRLRADNDFRKAGALHRSAREVTAMTLAARRHPALLKLDLFCRGLRIDEGCHVAEDGGRDVLRTRAGLGSGLELIPPGGLWAKVPVTAPFAAEAAYGAGR